MGMEWKEVRLGDYISIKHGYAFPGSGITTEDNNMVLVTPGNFQLKGGFKEEKCKFFHGEIPSDYILKEGDLIVTMTDLSKDIDTLGYSAIIPQSNTRTYLHNQRIGLISINSADLDKSYLNYLMRTYNYQRFIANSSTGTTVHHTSPSRIYDYTFELPSIEDQKRIADILSSLDAKIENNNKINAKLEEMAQALFKSWFIDFEPFKVGRDGSRPAFGSGNFIESELGMIPEGWKVGKLKEICKTNKRSGNKFQTQILYLDTGSITNNIIEEYQNLDPAVDKIPSRAKRLVTEGDIVYSSVRPNQRHFGLLFNPPSNLVVSTGFIVITANYSCYRYYIYKYLTQDNVVEKLHSIAEQSVSTYPSINASDIENIELIIPPIEVVDKFAAIIMNNYQESEIIHNENTTLAQTRDTLLPKLMSGEIEL